MMWQSGTSAPCGERDDEAIARQPARRDGEHENPLRQGEEAARTSRPKVVQPTSDRIHGDGEKDLDGVQSLGKGGAERQPERRWSARIAESSISAGST